MGFGHSLVPSLPSRNEFLTLVVTESRYQSFLALTNSHLFKYIFLGIYESNKMLCREKSYKIPATATIHHVYGHECLIVYLLNSNSGNFGMLTGNYLSLSYF